MVYLNNIIDFINQSIRQRLTQYPTANLQGLATATVVNQQGSAQRVFPSVIDMDGKADVVKYAKQFPFSIWHRSSTTNVTIRSNYGDSDQGDISTITEMTMVVIGNRSAIKVGPDLFSYILMDTIPGKLVASEFGQLGINEITSSPVSINHDPQSVFSAEFKGVPYFIGPEMFMFSIRYRILGSYQKGCLSNCNC